MRREAVRPISADDGRKRNSRCGEGNPKKLPFVRQPAPPPVRFDSRARSDVADRAGLQAAGERPARLCRGQDGAQLHAAGFGERLLATQRTGIPLADAAPQCADLARALPLASQQIGLHER